MKTLVRSSLVLLAAVVASLGPSAQAGDGFEPLSAQFSDRAVVMKLPEGVRRVRLRVRIEEGLWQTCTIAHLAGNEGFLKLRLPDGVAIEDLEVGASWQDPFPYQFYQGKTDHDGDESATGTRAAPTGGPQAFDMAEGAPDEETTVEESDIWKWRGDTLYFFNQYRGLQVIDVSDPAAPARLASLRLASQGEQMYLHPETNLVVLLTHNPRTGQGEVSLVEHDGQNKLSERENFPVPGYILESRLVGKMLYVVSRNSWEETVTEPDGPVHLSWRSGLAITKIDLNDPAAPVASPSVTISSDRYNYWGAQVQATAQALLVATNSYDSARRQSLSTVHVIDISDPYSRPVVRRHLPVRGQVLNKFNMHLDGDVLTVVSQVWRWNDGRQTYASVETFDLSRTSPRLAGIEFASNESITATRFVGDLLYVVTFFRVDPLFVVALADPSRPRLLSELEIPGFSTYLEPLGKDGLLSIGVEGSRIAVSWFDVSDPTNTSLASRVYVGAEDGWTWTEANWDEKALGYYPDDGLVLVPYQGSSPDGGSQSGVQLVELGDRELVKRGSFEHEFQARRARVIGDAVVSISGRSLRSLDITDRDAPELVAELILAWPADLVHRKGDYLVQLERGPFSWWTGSQNGPARVHVSPVADSDELLTSLDLPGGRIAGSVLRGSSLYLAQSETITEDFEGEIRSKEMFTTTIVDLEDPASPRITGRAIHTNPATTSRFGSGADYVGAFLPDGALVWYPSQPQSPRYFWDIPFAGGIGIGPAVDMIFPFFPTANRVYTLDVSDRSRPEFLATADLSGDQDEWAAGRPLLLGSTILYGLQTSAEIETDEDRRKWVTRHWLRTLDLSDPARPVRGPRVSIPGTLEHVLVNSAGGLVVFTSRSDYQYTDGSYRSRFLIQASAFDGLDAFLLDELVAREDGYGPHVFDGRHFVAGTNHYTSEESSTTLSYYEWSQNDSFVEVRASRYSDTLHQLGVRSDLLVASGSQGLTFVDFRDPARDDPPTLSFPVRSSWMSPELIAIHEREQAHLPQGFAGVETLVFGDAFTGSIADANPAPAHEREQEWHPIPFATLLPSPASSDLILGMVPEESEWVYQAQITPLAYDGWMRNALALEPGQAIPPFSEDSDSDGRSNGFEYFTGSHPGETDPARSLEVSLTRGKDGDLHLTGSISLNPHAIPFLSVTPSLSFNLADWDESPQLFEEVDAPFFSGSVFRVREPAHTDRKAFLRVRLESFAE